jgi:hypothetical protein
MIDFKSRPQSSCSRSLGLSRDNPVYHSFGADPCWLPQVPKALYDGRGYNPEESASLFCNLLILLCLVNS